MTLLGGIVDEVDAAMRYFSDMLTAHMASPGRTSPPSVP
jgi:hypothetical protein